ncbi:outer membrane beta-barrel family protein [uncultured Bacteroides sp.]|uniref:outer membrane beta-barrel family protein n=1 Tax=uncultured Bacteroides sp. TaxID=162156 RepID=UPI002AAA8B99|nr:outer membrane beta-barrel family protein [uncultured Bacteroides sp.]
MKRMYLFLISFSVIVTASFAQTTSSSTASVGKPIRANDSTYLFLDSLYMNLPEVMVKGERPIVKAEKGKLVYDLPRLVNNLPVDNAYEAIKELPGVVDMGSGLTLAGSSITVVINGKVSTMSAEQLNALLKSMPVSRIEKAEVMYSAPAQYQVRGPMINLVLKSGTGKAPSLKGELYTAWSQQRYETLTERASLLYSSAKFSADLLYSYSHNREYYGMDKKALHTVDGVVYPINLLSDGRSSGNKHNVRLGMDYMIGKHHSLSLVYNTQINNNSRDNTSSGSVNSTVDSHADDALHNVKLDYQAPFGLSAGAEYTSYRAPGDQVLHSTMDGEKQDLRYEDEQRINKWMFFAKQNIQLKSGWGLNYGANYTTATDHSFQYYYDTETGALLPDNSMNARHREQTVNGFGGFNKSFGDKLSVDASLAAELYHTEVWNEWTVFPTLNLNYTLAAGHILQLAFTADKSYPSYWSTNNTVAYSNSYTEIHGNPLLKPSRSYESSLTYIMKSKYVLTAYFNHQPDYFVQVPYQSSEKLVEINKYMNFNFRQEAGLQAVIPFKIKDRLNSRFILIGNYTREKDDDFWDVPFNRHAYSFMLVMNNTLTVSKKPDLKFTLSGFYQNGTIQGIYDLSRSGNLDAALKWTSPNGRAQFTVKGADLFNTSLITPDVHFADQNINNRFLQNTRTFSVSFSYKIGDYKEKKRMKVDTSRFK